MAGYFMAQNIYFFILLKNNEMKTKRNKFLTKEHFNNFVVMWLTFVSKCTSTFCFIIKMTNQKINGQNWKQKFTK